MNPVLLVSYGLIWLWTMGFLVLAMYLGAGTESIRRQLPMIALVAVGSLITIAAVAILPGIIGEGGMFALLIVANVMFLVWSRLPSRRRATPVPADPERMARARPVLKALAIVYVLGLAAVVIVILQASRTAG